MKDLEPSMRSEPKTCFTECRTERDVLIVDIVEPELHGEEPMQAFGQELLGAVDRSGVNKVVLNFTCVTYLTSAAFDPLTSLRHRLQARGGHLILCGLSPLIREVFEVAELIGSGGAIGGVFETQPHVAAAVAMLSERRA